MEQIDKKIGFSTVSTQLESPVLLLFSYLIFSI